MLLILLEWLVIFFFSTGFGLWMSRLSFSQTNNLFPLQLLGLFSILLVSTFWASVLPIDFYFFLFLFSISILGWIVNKQTIGDCLKNAFLIWKSWTPFYKTIILLFFLLVLMQSSTMPYIPDNDSYYRQTINWLNEYGLVNGLANLHIFLAQISGWHILQSSLNLSFAFPDLLNDLNGYFFVLFLPFSLQLFQDFRKSKKFYSLIFASFLLFSVFLFQFINTPSPDLPIFLLAVYVFYLFYELYSSSHTNLSQFCILFLMILFMILVKITTAPILILPTILFYKHKNLFKKLVPSFIVFSVLALTSFLLRNHIISGYPLYPLSYFSFSPDWQIATEIQEMYYKYTKMHAYLMLDWQQFSQLNDWERFLKWISGPKLHGFFNKLILLCLFTAPFILVKSKKAFVWLYFYCFLQLLILYTTSAQYRFFFHLLVFLIPLIAFGFLQKITKRWVGIAQKIITVSLVASICLCFFLMVFSVDFSRLTNNRFMETNSSRFLFAYLVKPHKNSRYNFSQTKIVENNFYYHHPIPGSDNFWVTGNIDLPALNKTQYNFFEENFGIIPQMRSNNLADGYKYKKLKKQ